MRALLLLLFGPGLLACDLDLARPNRGDFEPSLAAGEYFARSEPVAIDCPTDAPPLIPATAHLEVALADGTMTVRGYPAAMTGVLEPGGRFRIEGASATEPVMAEMEGAFLDPDDGRGFVAILQASTEGCLQRYRVRAH